MTIYGSKGGEVVIPDPEALEVWERELKISKETWMDKKFPHGIAGWRAEYALLHPWVILDEWWRQIKWGWQRVFRGWDNRVVWSIDYHLAVMIPQWLKKLKKTRHGVPSVMFEETDYGKDYYISEETLEWRGKQFDAILDKIILGFETYEEMQNEYDDDKLAQQKEIFNEGMKLFVEYFETLWD